MINSKKFFITIFITFLFSFKNIKVNPNYVVQSTQLVIVSAALGRTSGLHRLLILRTLSEFRMSIEIIVMCMRTYTVKKPFNTLE